MQRTRSDEVVDARMNLAAWLRAGRDRRKLTIEDVSKITKIQPRILEKLESGSLDGLPAEVFVKGFVRSFAKCVGLDESEALTKYSAAQAQPALAVAKALVDTISGPIVVEAAKVDASEPPAIEVVEAIAPVVEVAPAAEIAPVVETPVVAAAVEQQPKKKRSRKNSKQRARKKKQELAAAEAAFAEQLDGAVTSVFEKHSIETGPVAKIDGESLEATSIEAKTNDAIVATDGGVVMTDGGVVTDDGCGVDGVVDAPSLATGSDRVSQPVIAAEPEAISTGTWQPTMPPIAATPSVPWRRPNLPTSTTSAYVVPTLVIDDADPESADREREDRIAKEPHRLSFLPPILLDREDRSARQGGLTLAVIILLIAATLTLSYLMRRPSASGDGVTMLDGSSMLVG
jgi:hypothetical protein